MEFHLLAPGGAVLLISRGWRGGGKSHVTLARLLGELRDKTHLIVNRHYLNNGVSFYFGGGEGKVT